MKHVVVVVVCSAVVEVEVVVVCSAVVDVDASSSGSSAAVVVDVALVVVIVSGSSSAAVVDAGSTAAVVDVAPVGAAEGTCVSTGVGTNVGTGVGTGVGENVGDVVGVDVGGSGGVGLPLEFLRGQCAHSALGWSYIHPAARHSAALTYSGQSFARSGSSGSSSGTKTPKLSARYGRTAAAPSVAVPRDAAPTPRRRESASTFCASGSALSGSAGLRGHE